MHHTSATIRHENRIKWDVIVQNNHLDGIPGNCSDSSPLPEWWRPSSRRSAAAEAGLPGAAAAGGGGAEGRRCCGCAARPRKGLKRLLFEGRRSFLVVLACH